MEILYLFLLISAPLIIIIDFGQWIERLKIKIFYRLYSKNTSYEPFDWKPFDCSACLSIWIFWIYSILIFGFTFEYFLLGFIQGLITILIRKIIL
jgi:hypothetical protein